MATLGHAASGTWLTGSGAGNWTDSTEWNGGVIADGVDATATLEGPAAAGASIINLNGVPRTIGNILQTGTYTGGRSYTITGSTLTFDTTAGVPQITIAGSLGGATALRIESAIAGNDGLRITTAAGAGGGRVVWVPTAMSLTGGIEINNAILQTASFLTNAGFGTNTVTLSGTASEIQFAGINGSGNPISNNFVLGATQNTFNSARTAPSNSFYLTGTISETGGSRSVTYMNNSNSGTGSFYVSGNNSYTGNTIIGRADDGFTVLHVSNSNALGTGSSSVSFVAGGTGDDDALEMSSNITVSNKSLTLRGKGAGDLGSLRSVSGANTWAGNVALGTVADATVGVDAASTLTISGVVSGASTNGLSKVGGGTLVLSGLNAHTSGTLILEGTLTAASNSALGTGAVTVGDGSGVDVLQVGSNVNLSVTSLSLTSSAKLTFDLNGAFAQIAVSGDQLGSGIYTVDILKSSPVAAGTYTLLTVAGTSSASGFTFGQVPASLDGTLSWNSGVLSLTVVPEPGTLGLLIIGTGMILWQVRRRFGRIR